ncbi:MAG TPA: NOP5/NOP56 family protein [archaeon]|nr:NOP5/NOP56 family protein [archaeon]
MARKTFEMQKLDELRKKMIYKTKERVREAYTSRDVLVVQAINAIDELAAITNTMTMRLREWYSVYFPEMGRQVTDSADFVKAVQGLPSREGINEHELSKALGEGLAKKIASLSKSSMGAPLNEDDLKTAKQYAHAIEQLQSQEAVLEGYLEKVMKEIAPNTSMVAGPKLGAKLIAHAGSLEKLAMLPSSTIQIMGAEKALFKHLKQGKKPPKHGLIFQHSAISTGKQKLRGKIARTIAAKISIACKEDYFSKGKKDNGAKLLGELNKRLDAIRAQG